MRIYKSQESSYIRQKQTVEKKSLTNRNLKLVAITGGIHIAKPPERETNTRRTVACTTAHRHRNERTYYQTTMKTISAMAISMLLLHAHGAPQSKPAKKIDAIRNPSDLSYEELKYIDQMRRGGFSKPPKRLSPCAKAILGCCEEKVIDPECSEALQCGAHFFDDNPCDDKFIVDALNAARLYYDQFNKVNT